MPRVSATEAERPVQRQFSRFAPLAIILQPVAVLLAAMALGNTPDRQQLGPRLVPLTIERLDLSPGANSAGWTVWQLTSDDPRFGGISALATDDEGLVALTDAGAAIRFARPGEGPAEALIDDLPDGPGDGGFKQNRDSEALLRDPRGRGWWVAFERHNEVWLYDRAFGRPLRQWAIPADRLGENSGIEAMVADSGDLLLIAESGAGLMQTGSRVGWLPISGQLGRVSDAAALPDGDLLLVERRLTPLGFANALVRIRRSGLGFEIIARMSLRLGPLANVEAIALDRPGDGGQRAWLMTDDNFQRPLRTLLIAVELPPDFVG